LGAERERSRLGEVAVVDNSAAGAIPYTGIIRFRPLNHRVLQGFIRYALVAPSFRRQIEAMGVGSVLRHFGPMHLQQMTLDLPPLPEQRAIAVVLGALDEKIGGNTKVIPLSAELAGARFSEAADDVVTLSDVAAITMGQSPPG